MASDEFRVYIPVDELFTPVNLAIVKGLLEKQGLHVVTTGQKAVLDAMAALRVSRNSEGNPVLLSGSWGEVLLAELALRETNRGQ